MFILNYFIRFFNITVSIAEISRDGIAGTLGKRVVFLYSLTTILAVTNGCIMAVAFSSLLSKQSTDDDDGNSITFNLFLIFLFFILMLFVIFIELGGVKIELLCPKSFGKLSVLSSGALQCVENDSNITRYKHFSLIDTDNFLVNDAPVQRTLLEQILSIFDSLVPNNVVQSFAIANIISVIAIAIIFGFAMSHILKIFDENRSTVPTLKPSVINNSSNTHNNSDNHINQQHLSDSIQRGSVETINRSFTPGMVFDFCKEMSLICNLIIQWIVVLAPYCIAFLVAGSLSDAGNIIFLFLFLLILKCYY